MPARIFKQVKHANSSGMARTKLWTLVFEPEHPGEIEPLMGWTSSRDTSQQVRINFDSREEAVAYCEREGIPFSVEEPASHEIKRRTMAYADNFKFNRVGPWTH